MYLLIAYFVYDILRFRFARRTGTSRIPVDSTRIRVCAHVRHYFSSYSRVINPVAVNPRIKIRYSKNVKCSLEADFLLAAGKGRTRSCTILPPNYNALQRAGRYCSYKPQKIFPPFRKRFFVFSAKNVSQI